MDDLISRQAAIATAISGRVRTLPTTEDGENWIRVNEVRDSLLSLPSAQPEPRWIPVEDKERLPREGQRVLVIDEYGEIDIAYYIDYTNIGEGIEWWTHDFVCYPIAWSELPKPYERSEK